MQNPPTLNIYLILSIPLTVKYTQFTVDKFPDNNIHFLDIQIFQNGTTVYRKPTHTGQYQHYSSYTSWSGKISWIRALIHRAHKICSNDELLKAELSNIAFFMLWNGFSRKLTKELLTLLKTSTHNPCNTVTNNSIIEPSTIKIWIHLPFLGKYGTKLTNSFIRKKSPLLKSPCKFIVN